MRRGNDDPFFFILKGKRNIASHPFSLMNSFMNFSPFFLPVHLTGQAIEDVSKMA
jgi:hypothetical protein